MKINFNRALPFYLVHLLAMQSVYMSCVCMFCFVLFLFLFFVFFSFSLFCLYCVVTPAFPITWENSGKLASNQEEHYQYISLRVSPTPQSIAKSLLISTQINGEEVLLTRRRDSFLIQKFFIDRNDNLETVIKHGTYQYSFHEACLPKKSHSSPKYLVF